ncbi:MAG: radical SAM protein [bacterium]
MRIALIYPNQVEYSDLVRNFRYVPTYRGKDIVPLGMLYVCGNLSHEVSFLDASNKNMSNDEVERWALERNPDVVGFGGTFCDFPQAREVSARLRKRGIRTLYGGPNATVRPEKHIEHFDFLVRGEGETTTQELLDALEAGRSPAGIPGVSWRDGATPTHNPDRMHHADLDALAPPARRLINIADYRRDMRNFDADPGGPTDVVTASRGCPAACRFCSSKYFWKGSYRTRKPERVIEEIKFMMNTCGTKGIHFREDNFTINKKWVFEMCDALEELRLPWICQSRVASITDELVKRMKEAGCAGISCGFESANDHTLKYLKKGLRVEDTLETVRVFERYGMKWSGGFMAGVLNENADDVRNTFAFVRRLTLENPHARLNACVVRFIGIPVSDTYFEMIREGLVEYDWQDGEMLIPRTRHLTGSEVEALIDREYYRLFAGTSRGARRLKYRILAALPHRFISGAKTLRRLTKGAVRKK